VLQKGGKKLDRFLESLGRREKQTTLRDSFNQARMKNIGDFNDNSKVQSKLSFSQSTSTKKPSQEHQDMFMTPKNR
jgi:hypothetical protein